MKCMDMLYYRFYIVIKNPRKSHCHGVLLFIERPDKQVIKPRAVHIFKLADLVSEYMLSHKNKPVMTSCALAHV